MGSISFSVRLADIAWLSLTGDPSDVAAGVVDVKDSALGRIGREGAMCGLLVESVFDSGGVSVSVNCS